MAKGSQALQTLVRQTVYVTRRHAIADAVSQVTFSAANLLFSQRRLRTEVPHIFQPLVTALELDAPYVPARERRLLGSERDVTVARNARRADFHMRDEPCEGSDGKVSVSFDFRAQLREYATWQRWSLVEPHWCPNTRQWVVRVAVGGDLAGLTKKGYPYTVYTWSVIDSPYLRTTRIDTHPVLMGNFKDSEYDPQVPHVARLRKDMDEIEHPSFQLPHPHVAGEACSVEITPYGDGAWWCCAGGGDTPSSNFPLCTTTAHKDLLDTMKLIPPCDVSLRLQKIVTSLRDLGVTDSYIDSNKPTFCGVHHEPLLGREVYRHARCSLHLDQTNTSRMHSKCCANFHAHAGSLDDLGAAFTDAGFKGEACDSKTGHVWIISNKDGSRRLRDENVRLFVKPEARDQWGGPQYKHAYLLACQGMIWYAHAQPVLILRNNDRPSYKVQARSLFARYAMGRRVVIKAAYKNTTGYDTSMASLVAAHVVDAAEADMTYNAVADGSGLEMTHGVVKPHFRDFGGGRQGSNASAEIKVRPFVTAALKVAEDNRMREQIPTRSGAAHVVRDALREGSHIAHDRCPLRAIERTSAWWPATLEVLADVSKKLSKRFCRRLGGVLGQQLASWLKKPLAEPMMERVGSETEVEQGEDLSDASSDGDLEADDTTESPAARIGVHAEEDPDGPNLEDVPTEESPDEESDHAGNGGKNAGFPLREVTFQGPTSESSHLASVSLESACSTTLAVSYGKVVELTLTVKYSDKPPPAEQEAGSGEAAAEALVEDRSRALLVKVKETQLGSICVLDDGLCFDLVAPLTFVQTKCGVNNQWKKPADVASGGTSYASAVSATRVIVRRGHDVASSMLTGLISAMRSHSTLLDDMLPVSADIVARDDLPPPPAKLDPVKYTANMASLELLEFTSMGPGGPKALAQKLSALLASYFNVKFDFGQWKLVPVPDGERVEPWLGSKENPCECTSCKRRVFVECDATSPHYGRWCLFAEDVGKGVLRWTDNKGSLHEQTIDDVALNGGDGRRHTFCEGSNLLQLQHLLDERRAKEVRRQEKERATAEKAERQRAAVAAREQAEQQREALAREETAAAGTAADADHRAEAPVADAALVTAPAGPLDLPPTETTAMATDLASYRLRYVQTNFPGLGDFVGRIVETDETTGLRIKYADGEKDDITIDNLQSNKTDDGRAIKLLHGPPFVCCACGEQRQQVSCKLDETFGCFKPHKHKRTDCNGAGQLPFQGTHAQWVSTKQMQ